MLRRASHYLCIDLKKLINCHTIGESNILHHDDEGLNTRVSQVKAGFNNAAHATQ